MRNFLLTFCLILCLGCGAVNAPTPPTAPPISGAVNQFDSDTYRALATAHAFAQQAASDPSTVNSTTKTILNQFIADINVADALYSAWHTAAVAAAASATPLPDSTQLSAAVAKVKVDQNNFSTTGVK